MVWAIHTTVSGRGRFRVQGLYRSERLKKHLEKELSKNSGIVSCSASVLTGNILVIFDSRLTCQAILVFIQEIVSKNEKSPVYPRGTNQGEKSLPLPVGPKATRELCDRKEEISPRKRVGLGKRLKEKMAAVLMGEQEPRVEPWHSMEASETLSSLATPP